MAQSTRRTRLVGRMRTFGVSDFMKSFASACAGGLTACVSMLLLSAIWGRTVTGPIQLVHEGKVLWEVEAVEGYPRMRFYRGDDVVMETQVTEKSIEENIRQGDIRHQVFVSDGSYSSSVLTANRRGYGDRLAREGEGEWRVLRTMHAAGGSVACSIDGDAAAIRAQGATNRVKLELSDNKGFGLDGSINNVVVDLRAGNIFDSFPAISFK